MRQILIAITPLCLLVAVFAMTFAPTRPAAADEPITGRPSAEFEACMDQTDGVSTKMLDCGKAEIGNWDARLNAAYQTLLQRSEGKERAQLQREQRAWLKHHLSETHRLAVDPHAGSVAFLESQAFELQDLSDRTLALEKRVREAP